MTTQSVLAQPQTDDYSHLEPLPDPPREPDMQQHKSITYIEAMLLAHFAHESDVLLFGEGYLRNIANDESEVLVPDMGFVRGVIPDAIISRNGYVISEVGKPPDLVLEVASESTGRRDFTVKRDGYEAYGVQEYWRFDHTGGRFHNAPLAGDSLIDGRYVPIEIIREPDGRLWGYSEVLELELWWDDGMLRFRDPATNQFLPTPEELRDEAEQAQAQAESERAHRQQAQAQAENERNRRQRAEARAQAEHSAREAAESRLAELEAELRSLRGE